MITKEELERQLARKSPQWWAGVNQRKGAENYYYDLTCRKGIVTIDKDAGTTPMAIACRATTSCGGKAISQGYPDQQSKPAWLGPPTYEWYRPEEIDDDADTVEADHLMNGGLLLRRITSGAAQAQPE